MSPKHPLRVCLVAWVAAIGCAEESTTSVASAETAAADLSFDLPELSYETLAHAVVEQVEAPAPPAGALQDESDPPDQPDMDEFARIVGAATNVGFTSTYAYSTGRHSYTGNVGKVETEAVVTLNGQVLGRQPAMRQNYVPYLADWGSVKSIWAEAYVFTDIDCGLRVDGDSDHSAWWQWFMGGPAPKWGDAIASSQAFPPGEQPACTDTGLDPGGDSKDAGTDGSGPTTCWYWVEWDPYTGEILDSEFLYCDNVVGG